METYGASKHYLGSSGESYFARQHGFAATIAGETARKFRAQVKPQHTVVDFGCGGGYLLERLNCQRRIGVELNPAAREAMRGNNIECYATLSEVPDGIADVVISHHALEHVPYPAKALEALRHKLRNGGLLLLCVPIDDWRTQRRFAEGNIDNHLHTWTPQLLGNTLVEAGFPVISADIRVLRHAIHPAFAGLRGRLPGFAFDALCSAASIALKRRELFATVPKDREICGVRRTP